LPALLANSRALAWLRRCRRDFLGDHPLCYFEHGHFPALPTQHFPAKLHDAAALAAAEVLVDVF
jgi:hypothetical protein